MLSVALPFIENLAKILSADWLCLTSSEKNQSIISNGDFFFSHNDFSLLTVNYDLAWHIFILV